MNPTGASTEAEAALPSAAAALMGRRMVVQGVVVVAVGKERVVDGLNEERDFEVVRDVGVKRVAWAAIAMVE